MPTFELRPWQRDVLGSMPRDLLGMGAPVIGIKAPTGSGKTLLALRVAEKFKPSVVIAVVRTWTEMARFWEDARRFGYRYKPLAFFAKAQHCLELRKRLRKKTSASKGGGGGEGGDEEGGLEEDEVDVKCDECLLHDNLYMVGEHGGLELKYPLDGLLSVYSSVNPNLEYHKYKRQVRDGLSLISSEFRTGGFCTYDHLRTIAKEAVRSGTPILLIGTYPYVFGPPSILFRRVLGGSGRIVVIIDEAHNLDTLDFLERSISNVRLDKLVSTCEKYCSKEPGRESCSGLDRLKRLVNTVEERLVRIVGSYDAERTFRHPKPGHLWELVSLLSLVRDEAVKFTEFETGGSGPVRGRTVLSFIDTVDFMVRLYEFKARCRVGVDSYWDYDPSVWGFYITRGERSVRLVAKPFAVKPIIQYAWTRFNGPWILMSGTLPDEQYIEKVWGLGVSWYVDASEKVHIGRRKVVISVREGLTSSFSERNDEMFRKYADKIRWIVLNNNEPGVYLVVYPSYKIMKNVTWYLADLPVPQRREGEVRHLPDLVEEALGLYVSGGKLVVHAVSGGRFTEGVEFVRRLGNGKVESLVKHVILAGVPFPNASDDFVRDRVLASGLGEWEWFNVHGWLNTVQAIGRAFRSEGDEATIWLLDYRFDHLAGNWGITRGAVWVRRE
jgi:Rad3-related DNA helicase